MPPEAADRTTRTPPRRFLHEFENVCPETDIRMKRLVALWLCATVWLSVGGQSRDWANTGRYAAANAALAVRPKVVFIGDSITEGWYSAPPSFFDANGFVARGISGQVTAQMLARFQCDVVALRPRAVVILAGTDDIARNNGPIDEERIAGAQDAGLPLFGASGGALRLAPRSDRRSRPDRPAQPDAAGVCA